MPNLTVITINTWKGEDDYNIRLTELRNQLILLKPDVIFLQECFEAPSIDIDTITFLNKAFNFHLDYVQTREKFRAFKENLVPSFSNLAILSRLPICNTFHYPLPNADNDAIRFVQEIEILLENGTTALLTNVHLTHIDSPKEIKLEQIKCITERILYNNQQLHIIGGDFNCHLSDMPIQYLMNNTNLIESFSYFNPQSDTNTLVSNSHTKKRGVDFIFVNKVSASNTIIDSTICMNKQIPTSFGYCSDHFGILVNMKYD